MKYRTTIICCAIVFLFLSSCNRYYYKPNAVNAPLFTDGGQAHVAVVGSVGSANGDYDHEGTRYVFDVQAAVSPINHLGIIANYSTYGYTADNPEPVTGNVDGKANLLEFGIGGYYAKGNKFKMVADCYMGYGAGQIRSDVDMRIKRFFIQPGIGVRSPVFDAAFNLRMSSVRYDDFDAKGKGDDYLENKNLINSNGQRRIDNTTYAFIEPAFTIRTGYQFMKVQMQVALAQELTSVPWQYSGARYTVGLYFSLEDAIAEAVKNR
ncbi:MAG TPA: hypothetical protein VFV68_01285 [Agriterribacter sp.]|nr:hypothetical protein [Agriterribacter sp.]